MRWVKTWGQSSIKVKNDSQTKENYSQVDFVIPSWSLRFIFINSSNITFSLFMLFISVPIYFRVASLIFTWLILEVKNYINIFCAIPAICLLKRRAVCIQTAEESQRSNYNSSMFYGNLNGETAHIHSLTLQQAPQKSLRAAKTQREWKKLKHDEHHKNGKLYHTGPFPKNKNDGFCLRVKH